MKVLIALLDVWTEEREGVTRLDNIKMSTEHLDLPTPVVGERIMGTNYAPVTWVVKNGPEFRALVKYMDETEAAYVVTE